MWRLWLITCACGRIAFDPLGDGGPGGGGGDDDGGGPGSDAIGDITHNIVFVTSTKTTIGTMGGVAGANAICNMRAQAKGLPGTYVAWLSTTNGDAFAALAGSRGWGRPDGKPVADTVTDLLAGHILYPPVLDETQMPVFGEVITGTLANGTVNASNNCGNYAATTGTYQSGYPMSGTADWTQGSTNLPCSGQLQFYCFGIGKTVGVAPDPITPSRGAFLLAGNFVPGTGGIGLADSACITDAGAASLNGTYRALLANGGASAMSRFSTTGPPWRRMDNVLIAPTAADFAQGSWDAPIDLNADGVVYQGRIFTFIGAASLTGAPANTCTGWTTTAGNADGGQSTFSSTLGFAGYTLPCNTTPARIYCLEL